MRNSQKILKLLQELARIPKNRLNAEDALNQSLRLMAKKLNMKQGEIAIINPGDGKIHMGAAHGPKPANMRQSEYPENNDLIRQVIVSGRPMYMRCESKEPIFMDSASLRDSQKETISLICAPIIFSGEALGAISVDGLLPDGANPRENLDLLRIIAALLAPWLMESQASPFSTDSRKDRPREFVGNSQAMRQVYAQIGQVAPSQLTVFLQGESGTGKELAARAIHAASARPDGPFVALNCAALPENLIESELFGHEKGAFTGAAQTRKGRFELADGGTLFLDEIGELGFRVQAKLLRVLQEHSFERLGGMRSQKVDVRVIAATNRDMEQMVAEGSFRRDLFYRLNVFPIYLPPLRERLEDIPALAEFFLRNFASASGRKPPRVSLGCMDLLQRYDWPGNIRELQNVMERALLLLGNANVILPAHLPENIRKLLARAELAPVLDATGYLKEKIAALEKDAIIAALESACGHIGKAARALGVTERVLSLRLGRYNLNYKDFRKKNDD